MARPRQFALVLLCATVTIAGWCAARLGGFEGSGIENTATPIWNRGAARGATISNADAAPVGALAAHAIASVAAVTTFDRRWSAFSTRLSSETHARIYWWWRLPNTRPTSD
jgi:hypothetical protein